MSALKARAHALARYQDAQHHHERSRPALEALKHATTKQLRAEVRKAKWARPLKAIRELWG